MLIFSILGAIEIGEPNACARLTGTMQQTLVAALLVSTGTLVTVDSLMDELWGTTPPAKAGNALQAQISRLRRRLAELEPHRTDSRLQTSVSGYALEIERDELDAWRFTTIVDHVRARVDEGYRDELTLLRQDIAELRQALALWRGPVFGGLTGGPICQRAAGRYQESSNAAQALLYELELRSGAHARVLPELTELAVRHPLQEQFCKLLMLALYRSGRHIDALSVYRQFRHRLVENLGIEPSPNLRRYEQAILAHDPILISRDIVTSHRTPVLSSI